MLNYISILIVPLMLAIIISYGLMNKLPVFELFVSGAKEGIETTFQILPALIGLITAIAMLRASGALDAFGNFISPVISFISVPKEIVPLAVMRPISGSGSLAIVNDIINTYGADSFIGRCASVMMGSTETTFYTLAIYLGSVGIKNSRYTVKAALLADLTGILASVYIVRWLLG